MTKEKIIVKNKEQLINLIEKEIQENGNKCDLNHLDISNLTDLTNLFKDSDFNGDISDWNTSNVKNMSYIFSNSEFNGDISNWDVSNVTYMDSMFYYSKFNTDISKWNVSNVKNMNGMFNHSFFNGNISKWNVSNVKDMSYMFDDSYFTGDISKWDTSNLEFILNMFNSSEFDRYDDLNNWKPYKLLENIIFNDDIKNKKVYWSKYNLDISKTDIRIHIDKYWAEKEKQLLINNNNCIELTSIKEKFKL